MSGRVTNLFLKPAHGSPMVPTTEVRAIEACGLEGDAAYGSNRRQVLLVDSDVLADFDLPPGSIRENVTVEGLPFGELAPGTHLEIGGAILKVTSECAPCEFLDTLRPGLQGQLKGQRGILAIVVSGGTIRVTDGIRVLPATPSGSGG